MQSIISFKGRSKGFFPKMKIKKILLSFEKNIAACFRAKDSCHSKSCYPYSMLLPCISSGILLCHCSFSCTTMLKEQHCCIPLAEIQVTSCRKSHYQLPHRICQSLFVLSGHSMQYFLYSPLPQSIKPNEH